MAIVETIVDIYIYLMNGLDGSNKKLKSNNIIYVNRYNGIYVPLYVS